MDKMEIVSFFLLSFNSCFHYLRCNLFLLCSYDGGLLKHNSLEIENGNRGISCFRCCHVRIGYEVN